MKGKSSEGKSGRELEARLSVVLDRELAEHVRGRAFQERKSRSAFLRELVEADARANPIRLLVDGRNTDETGQNAGSDEDRH